MEGRGGWGHYIILSSWFPFGLLHQAHTALLSRVGVEDFVFEFRDGLCGRLDVSQIQELESSWTFSSSTSWFSVNKPQTVCSRAIRVLCMCMGLGDTDGQREIQVDMNKGEHEQRGKQRCMNRKSCQGRGEYVHSRNSRGIKILSGKMQKPWKRH